MSLAQPQKEHNLRFEGLAKRWDEAMPLGNGMLGVLVWQKNSKLRLSLDRADLWDERKALDISKLNFNEVEEQVRKKDFKSSQQLAEDPYHNLPYPTKIPAAAVEFDMTSLGKAVSNVLDIQNAINTIQFDNGTVFKCFIHAAEQRGYFSFSNLPAANVQNALMAAIPQLIVHNYSNNKDENTKNNSHSGGGLVTLGYSKGTVVNSNTSILYHQPTYDNHYFEVLLKWQKINDNQLVGCWTITNDTAADLPANCEGFEGTAAWHGHTEWWKSFWSQSAVSLPDTLLERQYYLEQYKLGCIARAGAPAITLQGVWTADNGSLPPWKGDFHNDLNTQLSYWPAYTGNHLREAATYTDWLWKIRQNNEQYTKQYFGVEGLNVPGVAAINGDPMGGWMQYSLSPSAGSWCAQHFYWQWKYSMDEGFLKNKAYPYIHEVATFLENVIRHKEGVRKLPLSSSPEYNSNSINAWFFDWSNYDLSLAKFLFSAASELSIASGKPDEAKHWQTMLNQLPAYDINETGLTVAPGQNLNSSHRHMSHCMAIYPLGLLDINNSNDKTIINNSLKRIEQIGTRGWCGYSFSWAACLYARAYQADSSVKELKIFASNFCSPNSFHLNGDQKGGQYSGYTYRPFTLEGNFAFAQGINELLLQSRKGYIQVFPAVPDSWQNVSFNTLRAEGGFLISAERINGVTSKVVIKAEKAGKLTIKLPADIARPSPFKTSNVTAGAVEYAMKAVEEIVLKTKNN
jgi:alpha-L-fucosidase 2